MDQSKAMLEDKARRIGITYADSYKSVRERNIIDHRRDLWFSSADESAAYEYALYCRQWCEMMNAAIKQILEVLEDDKGYKYNNYIVEFPNGSRINCMSSNPRRFRSKGGDVVLDEFDWHDQPGEMLDAAMPVTTWGYNIRILTTRSSEGTPFDRLVNLTKKVLAGETTFEKANSLPWSYHRTTILDAVDQGLAEKIYKLDHIDLEARKRFIAECRARCRDEDAWLREYMCTPSSAASTLIPYDLYQACEDSNCLKVMGDGPKYLGFDIGREKDLTVYWLWEKVGDVLVTRKVLKLFRTPYATQLAVGRTLLADPTVLRACGDATGIGDMMVESLQNEYGKYRVEKVKFTGPIKEHLASQVLTRAEDKRLRLPADAQIRESFHSVKKTITVAGNIRFDSARTEDGHADDFWAAALGVEAASSTAVTPECILL